MSLDLLFGTISFSEEIGTGKVRARERERERERPRQTQTNFSIFDPSWFKRCRDHSRPLSASSLYPLPLFFRVIALCSIIRYARCVMTAFQVNQTSFCCCTLTFYLGPVDDGLGKGLLSTRYISSFSAPRRKTVRMRFMDYKDSVSQF